MSRSGYCDGDWWDEGDQWRAIRWAGALKRAKEGHRGQAFFREMLAALDAMPVKRLVRSALVCADGCCAMGAVAIARQQDVSGVDPEDPDQVAFALGIASALAADIADRNDDDFGCYGPGNNETPEQRWHRVRGWVLKQIQVRPEELSGATP